MTVIFKKSVMVKNADGETLAPEELARRQVLKWVDKDDWRYTTVAQHSANSRAAELAMSVLGPIQVRDYMVYGKSFSIRSKLFPKLTYIIGNGVVFLKSSSRLNGPAIGHVCINLSDGYIPYMDGVVAKCLLALHSEPDLWSIGNMAIYNYSQDSHILPRIQSRMRWIRAWRFLRRCTSWIPRIAYKLIGG